MVIHPNKLRWLFWLRWRMFTRSYRGSVWRIIGGVMLFLLVLFFGGLIATGSFFAYRFLPTPINIEILYLVLTGLFLMWLILPLLEYTTNEGLDISKLALFPLTRAELMASLVISTLLDIPTVGLVLLLGAVVIGWSTSLLTGTIALLAMLIFYVQLVAASQLLLAFAQKLLRSRKFRDISVILVVIFSSSGYLCQFVAPRIFRSGFPEALETARISPYLQWLPSGMAANAIQQSVTGNWQLSIVWLAILTAVTLFFLFCWQLIVERGLTAADSGGTVKTVQRKRTTTTQHITLINRFLPSQIRAIAQKELKYYWRDPQLKANFLRSLFSIVFLVVYFGFSFFNSSGGKNAFSATLSTWAVLVIPLPVLFSLYGLTYNTLGLERQSLTTLFLFPVSPKAILYGKNLVIFCIGLLEMFLIVVVASALTQTWLYLLPALIVGITGTLITIGLGNVTSIFLPQKVRLSSREFRTNNSTSSAGCMHALLSLLAFGALQVLLVPVAASIVVPILFHVQWVWFISLPLALIYGVGIYYAVTHFSAPYMLTRTPEIVAVVTKE